MRDDLIADYCLDDVVSVEPLPKQGCELAEALAFSRALHRLSGTPAEAGVRVLIAVLIHRTAQVSVEPLPKQGCEGWSNGAMLGAGASQWNPCRSRGASSIWSQQREASRSLSGTPAEAGVRVEKRYEVLSLQVNVSVEPLPKQGCELKKDTKFFHFK